MTADESGLWADWQRAFNTDSECRAVEGQRRHYQQRLPFLSQVLASDVLNEVGEQFIRHCVRAMCLDSGVGLRDARDTAR